MPHRRHGVRFFIAIVRITVRRSAPFFFNRTRPMRRRSILRRRCFHICLRLRLLLRFGLRLRLLLPRWMLLLNPLSTVEPQVEQHGRFKPLRGIVRCRGRSSNHVGMRPELRLHGSSVVRKLRSSFLRELVKRGDRLHGRRCGAIHCVLHGRGELDGIHRRVTRMVVSLGWESGELCEVELRESPVL